MVFKIRGSAGGLPTRNPKRETPNKKSGQRESVVDSSIRILAKTRKRKKPAHHSAQATIPQLGSNLAGRSFKIPHSKFEFHQHVSVPSVPSVVKRTLRLCSSAQATSVSFAFFAAKSPPDSCPFVDKSFTLHSSLFTLHSYEPPAPPAYRLPIPASNF